MTTREVKKSIFTFSYKKKILKKCLQTFFFWWGGQTAGEHLQADSEAINLVQEEILSFLKHSLA